MCPREKTWKTDGTSCTNFRSNSQHCERWNGKQRSIWRAWNLLKTNKCEYIHNWRLPITAKTKNKANKCAEAERRNLFHFHFLLRAFLLPIDRLFCPLRNTHECKRGKNWFLLPNESNAIHDRSQLKKPIFYVAAFLLISYFNHDRLIAFVLPPRPLPPFSSPNEFVDPAVNRTWIELTDMYF